MKTSQDQVLLHLSLIGGIGPATIWYLIRLQSDKWSWSDLYNLSLNSWMCEFGLTQRVAEKLVIGLRDNLHSVHHPQNRERQILHVLDQGHTVQ